MRPDRGASRYDYGFGDHRLFSAERRVERKGVPVKLGARGFDLLRLLVENAGRTVSKPEIWAQVWSGIPVGEGSLRFQLVELRRHLGETSDNAFIATVPGQGYCFVAPVTPIDRQAAYQGPAPTDDRSIRLPSRLARAIGREAELSELLDRMRSRRFVTIVGTGGIGKTTLAVAAAHAFASEFAGDIHFIDLGAIQDDALIKSAIASAIGLAVQRADPMPDIVARLRLREAFLILDSVEHLIGAAAEIVERLVDDVPTVRLLATSREAIRLEEECVYPLLPFELPTPEQETTLDGVLSNPAARLFVERAAAAGSRRRLVDTDAALIAGICRQLDGIALAIELAAGRLPTYGLEALAGLLRGQLAPLRGGRRTAARRHRTLTETIAWSYDLLDGPAQVVLRMLAVFVGPFSLAAACAVASDGEADKCDVERILDDLVAQSLVSVSGHDGARRFRLLDTTRAYLLAEASGDELQAAARRHAIYFAEFLRWSDMRVAPDPLRQSADEDDIPNVRAALDWCFGPHGVPRVLTPLAVGSARLFLTLSLLAECRSVCEATLARLDPEEIGSRAEMGLQTALAQALMYSSGNSEHTKGAFERGLALASKFGERRQQLEILADLHVLYCRRADFIQGLVVAQNSFAIARTMSDPLALAASHLSLGVSLHQVGQLDSVAAHLDEAIGLVEADASHAGYASYSTHPNRARIIRAHALWLRGYPDRAAAMARASVREVDSSQFKLHRAVALSGIPPIFIWRGDWGEALNYIKRLEDAAEHGTLRPYAALAGAFRGEVAIATGDPEGGVAQIRSAMRGLDDAHYRLFTAPLMIATAQGLLACGEAGQARDVIESCEQLAIDSGSALHLPEIFRVKADILLVSEPGSANPEALLDRAIAVARDVSARGWELRSATRLAHLRSRSKRYDEAEATLRPVYKAFDEGQRTVDVETARQELHSLRTRRARASDRDWRALS
ncbi:putative ATPase/DNA-binding winged helix-turn-helix (wHTH) protein [Bosea sp. BE125]|uniref:ATP-binding protein n=1 Tax=Bosea sp. BE125 TaxID=2817909 RepID=UPI002859F8EB|nr:winged helix-turn-helix domain-containing protein [Bosea sp. BE125]MDR6873629.1 putative ATPase/DNA-binding winged helix-turn-helix (wHTH) protein [Bosea sp. BE125]